MSRLFVAPFMESRNAQLHFFNKNALKAYAQLLLSRLVWPSCRRLSPKHKQTL